MATETTVDFRGHTTWCRVTGDIDPDARRLPVVVLHGGPGAAHNYTLAMEGLARDGRAVVHYDQLGCGRSTHLPDAPADFWTPQLFVDEFATVVDTLGLRGGYHVVGQSWGGMLGAEIATRRPDGLASLSICNSPASMRTWVAEANRLREQLPPDVAEALTRHEEAGTTDSPEYAEAMQVFYERHVCRVVPFPDEVSASFAQIEAEPTVYHTMNGPSEFHVIGSLKDWDITDRLDRIDVPTLVIAGEHDEATPATWKPFVDGIADVRSHVFPGASHMPHVESTEEFLRYVGGFLAEHDRT